MREIGFDSLSTFPVDMESALPQKKKPKSGRKKGQDGVGACARSTGTPFLSPPCTVLELRMLPLHLYPYEPWTSMLMPWDCVHSLQCLHLGKTHIHFFCVHTCVCKSSCVCALKLHGEAAFNSCPQMYAVRCIMLIIPHFACVQMHPLQPDFSCFLLL